MKANLTAIAPDRREAEQFLAALAPSTQQFTFQTFDDNHDRGNRELSRVLNGTLDECFEQLERLSMQGAGIFVTINETDGCGRQAAHITRVRAVFVDTDGAPQEPIEADFPNIIVESSPRKFHNYWLVKDCPLEDFKPAQIKLAATYGTDKSVNDLSRVMRLPGFPHQKVDKKKGLRGTPFTVRMIETNTHSGPDQWEFRKAQIDQAHAAKIAAQLPLLTLAERAAAAVQPPCGNVAPIFDLGSRGTSYTSSSPTEAEARELLGYLDPDIGYRDWLNVLMALHDAGDAMLPLAIEWSSRGSTFRKGEIEKKWLGFRRGSGVGWATIPAMAQDRGAQLGEISSKYQAVDCRQKPTVAVQEITSGDEINLICNRSGRPAWCAENACLILEANPDWAGVFAYNEETALRLLLRPIPGSKTPKSRFQLRPITEADLTATLRWFNRNGFPDATRNIVADAVFATAAQSVIAPVRHYLEALSWDGVERISTWLSVYGGADDRPITRRMGRAWMISAVARALQPGCKADCALILEGGQGVGKSSAARVLASEDWFSDSLRDLHGKDASAALRGRWIIELPELSAMRRSETEAVKAFLSRTEERFRPAYARTEVIEPRRCVFIGTTNRTDYLTDDTGNRRFWPVSIKRFDLKALGRDRDQLWAEAVAAYRAGEPWWLDREAETEAAALTSQRQADDPWESVVLEAVIGKTHTSTREVLGTVGVDTVNQTKHDAQRVAGILNRAGWVREGKYTSGLDRGLARYVRPPSGEPQWGTS